MMMRPCRHGYLAIAGYAVFAFAFTGCLGLGKDTSSDSTTKQETTETTTTKTLTGTSWVPNVTGAGASNRDSGTTVTKTVVTSTGTLTGLGQAWGAREVSIDIDMTSDLGVYGSLTLQAEVTGFPAALQGSAHAMLTYL